MTAAAADRMSSLDAFFFYTEEDGVNHMHVGGFALVEGTAPTANEVAQALLPKLDRIPRYRQIAQPVPLHLGRPVWVDASQFDVIRHVRSTVLPESTRAALRTELETFISQPLERTRPLWELLLIDAVDADHWCIAWKIHHSMVDGVSGTELLTILFDSAPSPSSPPTVLRAQEPRKLASKQAIVLSSVTDLVLGASRTVHSIRPATARKLSRVGRAYLGLVKQTILPDLHSPLVGNIGPERSYDYCVVPFADIKEIRAGLGGTVNDVVLTAVLKGFSAVLTAHGTNVSGKSLQAMVPVALRPRDAQGRPLGDGTMETKASALIAKLPLDIDDPARRLRTVAERLSALKDTTQSEAITAINEMTALLPGTVTSVALRAFSKVPQRSLHTTVTNVPGPTMTLYVLGRRITTIGNYAPPFPIGARTSVTVYSYEGQLVFGITGDKASIPDVDVIATGIRRGIDELLAVSRGQ